jgi:hypothetical protein
VRKRKKAPLEKYAERAGAVNGFCLGQLTAEFTSLRTRSRFAIEKGEPTCFNFGKVVRAEAPVAAFDVCPSPISPSATGKFS